MSRADNLQDPKWQEQNRENFAKVREHRAAVLRGMQHMPRVPVTQGIIPACGDHPALVGYVVGKDDGKCLLYPTPERALEAEVIRLREAMEGPMGGPVRELTQAERYIYGECPVCHAAHGESCHADVGIQLGVRLDGQRMKDGEGVHLARLQKAPERVREVPA